MATTFPSLATTFPMLFGNDHVWYWTATKNCYQISNDFGKMATKILFLYQSEHAFATIENFKSMLPGSTVEATIICVWCDVLNDLERYKSPASPLRLFCSPLMTMITAGKSFDAHYEDFSEDMDRLLKQNTKYSLNDYEMVFFPVLASEHYWLAVFDIKGGAINILDNSLAGTMDKYREPIIHVQKLFFRYAQSKNHKRADEIRLFKPKQKRFSWQTKENHTDCAIFMMRHMEAYMGCSGTVSDVGLKDEGLEQNRQLLRLRSRYVHKIICHETNKNRDEVIQEATNFLKEKSKMDKIEEKEQKKKKKQKL